MPENSKVGDASTFRSLTAFKPRQVLLLLSSKQRLAMKHDSGKTLSMSKDQKALLLQSICLYLEKNGFSKTLNKFRSEAEMEKDSWKSCSLILEEIFIKHLQTNHANVDNNTVKGEFGLGDVTVHKVDKKSKDLAVDVDVKVEGKKREKIADSVPNHVTPSKTSSEGALSLMSKPTKKSKEKKKNDKLTEKSLNEESESHQKSTEIMGGMPMDGSSVKSKGTNDSENMEKNKSEEKARSKSKKKKQESVTPDGLCVGTEEITKLENKNEKEKERKSSKKRKNNSSEDNKPSHDEGKENSKRRKTNNSDEQVTEVMTSYANGNIAREENVDQQTPSSKTPVNGVMAKKEEDKSSTQRSTKKKQNNSAEPKALNAFQRVKADEIEFADERLQDNSYWAKDGADSGYGAKAQEVLGQVRGRGFRHEKTKKKRGSYRGGQIDLQSHSVKFVYEEEDA